MANKAGIINADTGVIVGVPDALVQVGGVWTIAATAPGTVPASRQINTTAPLTGGGDLSADRTLAIAAATAGNDGYMTSTQVATLATAASTAGAALPKAGGTMTGAIDMGSQKITSLGTPTATTDAATKGYVDTAVVGLLDLKGSIDCSGNPNYPAALKGDVWMISVAGLIGGASGISVQAGDAILALADNAGGTQAAVGSSWSILQANLVGALLAVNNLSDVQNVATARTNLGLGSAATTASTDYATAAQGTLASTAVQRAGDTMSGNLSIKAASTTYPLTIGAGTKGLDEYSSGGVTNDAVKVLGSTIGAPLGVQNNNAAGFSGVEYFDNTGTVRVFTGYQISTGEFRFNNFSAAPSIKFKINYTDRVIALTDTVRLIGNTLGACVNVQNTNASGFSGIEYWDQTGVVKTFTGYWNSTGEFRINQLAAGGTIVFKISGNDAIAVANSRAVTVPVSLKVGTSGTAITQQTVYTPSLTPASVSAGAPAEQTFTVTGLATTDTVTVNAPGAAVFNARVSAANTLAITFMPPAAGSYTPPAGTYRIVAIRS